VLPLAKLAEQLFQSLPVHTTGILLHVAALMAKANTEVTEMQRTLRTANRRERTDGELNPGVVKLLLQAASHLRSASQVCLPLLQSKLLRIWPLYLAAQSVDSF
jgi:hypothetical protein